MIHRLNRLRLVAALVGTILLSQIAMAQQTAPQTALDPQARQLITRMADYHKGLQGASVDITVTGLSAPHEQPAQTYAFAMTLQRPSRVLLEPKNPDTLGKLVSDGATLFATIPPYDRYLQTDAPPDIVSAVQYATTIAGDAGFGPAVVGTLFSPQNEQDLLERVTAARIVGTETIDGQATDILELTGQNEAVRLFIEQGETPLVWRVEADVTNPLAPGETGRIVATMRNWVLNPAVPAAAFAYQPPANLQKVESLDALFGTAPPTSALLGKPAPDFTLDLLDGGKLTLSQHKGKDVVILDFWATWCGPCLAAMPEMLQIAGDYKDRNVVFYAVNQQDTPAAITALLQAQQWTTSIPLDLNGEISMQYEATAIPHTVIIGKDGTVQAVHTGFDPTGEAQKQLRRQLDALIRGESLVAPPAVDAPERH